MRSLVKNVKLAHRQACGKRSFATSGISAPKAGVDWDNMSFSLTPTDFMYVATAKKDEEFKKGEIRPYGPLMLYPSAGVLNYGQGIFEGLKAFRTVKDRCAVFRPVDNLKRLNAGADRFMMSTVPEPLFISAVNEVVRANAHWIPPTGKGALYLRPLLFGSGAQLGVAPSAEYTFCIFVSPVGNYFKGGKAKPIDLLVTPRHRAAPRGSGDVKAIGNYAPAFRAQQEAKKEGYAEVLFLDARNDKYVEEAGASNFFIIHNNVMYTPELGSILPGVTRQSIMQLAKEKGIKVVEEKVAIDKVLEASEVFCTGTGASISPVGSVTFNGKKVVYNKGEVGKVSQDIYNTLLDVQFERVPDTRGWLHYP
eukprot:TRINITY_DN2521_c0_g1_i1.p1 TRINITY_DN2521_c0_g1~~TRINITY_DN2521_c0_g1_i1.p1  ORF type:complete len:365 (+),score=75.61 TRINITY_DN2521_c0_g1_i1:94-1188(+)